MRKNRSENIKTFYNIYLTLYDWHMKIWATKLLRYFALLLIIIPYLFLCVRNDWSMSLASFMISAWALVLIYIISKFYYSVKDFDMEGGVFDKYIKMVLEGFNRYGLIPSSDNYIMMGPDDNAKRLLEELDSSISRGAQIQSPYMLITDAFIVSRSDMSFQYSPVAVPKDMISEISFFDKGIVHKRRFAVYEFMNIKIEPISEYAGTSVLTRVVAKKGIFGRKKTITDYKIYPFDGIKIVESADHNGAVEII